MAQQDRTNDTVPQSGRAAIYVRVASRAQTPSIQPWTYSLIQLANEQGYPNEQIIVYEDAGVSSRKPPARRSALSDLIIELAAPEPERGSIKVIYTYSEKRLFRHNNAADISLFIQACSEHGVQLVTPTMRYDFTTPGHLARFCAICEGSTRYAEEHLISRLQADRQQKKRASRKAQAEKE